MYGELVDMTNLAFLQKLQCTTIFIPEIYKRYLCRAGNVALSKQVTINGPRPDELKNEKHKIPHCWNIPPNLIEKW
jgi:hypothetical protein